MHVLKLHLRRHEGLGVDSFPTKTFHLALELAYRVGHPLYDDLSQMRRRLVGDWLFSKEAFREEAPHRDARFVDDFADDIIIQLGSVTGEVGSPSAALYKAAADHPISAEGALGRADAAVSMAAAARVLDDFCEQGLMMRDGERFLSLALPATRGR
ncbi:Hypothetical protein A7982_04358 [Minicystis rosea]|nr:Hypothetical protein A7982_04358 [Minicystis rosea]